MHNSNKSLSIFFCQAFLIVFYCIFISGCAEKNEPVTIKIGDSKSIMGSVIYLGKEKGYFKQQGINVDIHYYPSGKRAQNALLRHEVEMSVTAETPFVIASLKDDSLRLYASIGKGDDAIRVLARRDHGINKPADLKTKSLGVQKGSAIHFFLNSFLLYHQIQVEKSDIQFLKVEDLSTALINGDIDAISIREPFLSEAKEALGAEKYIEFSVPGLYTKTYNLIAYKDFVIKNPGIMEKVLLAIDQAATFAEQYPKQAQSILTRRLELSPQQFSTLWKDIRLRVSLHQGLLSLINEQARWAVDSGLVKEHELQNGKIPDFIQRFDVRPLTNALPHAVHLAVNKSK